MLPNWIGIGEMPGGERLIDHGDAGSHAGIALGKLSAREQRCSS